jgi:anti-anti-sigma factor
MVVKFWGTRGSIPSPEPDCMKYGGDTSCVSIHSSDTTIILDAGTGIRKLGVSLLEDPSFSGKAYIFLSHSHWDHIQGFPFFKPAFIPGNEFYIHGAFKADQRLQTALKGQMGSIYFPVAIEDLQGSLKFIELIEEDTIAGNLTVRSRALNHPGGCFGYRISDGTSIVTYCTDTEPRGEGTDEKVIELAQGSDVLIYDSQFTPEEYATNRKGWGHSTWQDAIKVAHEANVKKLVLFHHDPYHSDSQIDQMVSEAQVFFPNTIGASRGLELNLGDFSLKESNIMLNTLAESKKLREKNESPFTISTDNSKKITLVKAPRDLSIFNSSSFSQTISRQLDLCNSYKLILDMSTLTFIDSSGLGSLATINEICRKKGIDMVIFGVSSQILQVLRITRIDHIIKITNTQEEALNIN